MFVNYANGHSDSAFVFDRGRIEESRRGKEVFAEFRFGGLERGAIAVCAARAAVSRIVRAVVRRWRPMVGIQVIQPRPSNLNRDLFVNSIGRRGQKFRRLTTPPSPSTSPPWEFRLKFSGLTARGISSLHRQNFRVQWKDNLASGLKSSKCRAFNTVRENI